MTIEQIRAANAKAGFHFFSPGTLSFFDSTIYPKTFEVPEGVAFITSERNRRLWLADVRYTVRVFEPSTSKVKNLSLFGEFNTGYDAARWIESRIGLGPLQLVTGKEISLES